MNQYRHNQLRERLRSAPEQLVRDVATWMTNTEARKRVELDPKSAVIAAGKALATATSGMPVLLDEACEILEPCFRKPLGPMRMRAYLATVLPEKPHDPSDVLREQNTRLYGALVQLIGLCERNAVITASDLAPYKKILEVTP